MEKRVGIFILLLICMAETGLLAVRIHQKQEMLEHQQAMDKIQNIKIAELEKEIRVLKTDMHVLQYGFEDENER